MPDRFGGDPHDWYGVGRELASRGYGVLITCADASARLLGVPAARMGSVNQPDPVQVEPAVQAEVPVESEVPVEPEVAVEPEAVAAEDEQDVKDIA
jgi:hypothetical protein